MSARKGAARRRKFKKWVLEVWSFAKGYISFSKLLVYAVLYIDYKSTMTTLDLCRISVANNYTGSLPYLTALIAFLQAATATVLSFSLNKSKAENTTGGITYDTATKRDYEMSKTDGRRSPQTGKWESKELGASQGRKNRSAVDPAPEKGMEKTDQAERRSCLAER